MAEQRLIDANTLLKTLDSVWDCNDMVFEPNDCICDPLDDCKGCKWRETLDFAKRQVKASKTVDAVPVIHARWERWVVDVAEHPWHCSHCGWPPPKHVCHIEDMEYCAHCGACMDEGDDSDG